MFGYTEFSGVAIFFTIFEIHQTGLIGFSIDGVINNLISIFLLG